MVVAVAFAVATCCCYLLLLCWLAGWGALSLTCQRINVKNKRNMQWGRRSRLSCSAEINIRSRRQTFHRDQERGFICTRECVCACAEQTHLHKTQQLWGSKIKRFCKSHRKAAAASEVQGKLLFLHSFFSFSLFLKFMCVPQHVCNFVVYL